MASRWTARRRSQTRIEENHTDRHHEKVGYLATYSSGRNRRVWRGTGECSDLKAFTAVPLWSRMRQLWAAAKRPLEGQSNSIGAFTPDLCRLAFREKRSECFLRLIGPYSFGEHLVLEFHSLLQLVTECRLHEPLACLHCAGGLLRQGLCGFRCCGQ